MKNTFLGEKIEKYKAKLWDVCRGYMTKSEFETLFERSLQRLIHGGEFGMFDPEEEVENLPGEFLFTFVYDSAEIFSKDSLSKILDKDFESKLFKAIQDLQEEISRAPSIKAVA